MEFKEEDVLRAYAVSNGIGWRAQSPEALKFSFHARTSHVSGQNEKEGERERAFCLISSKNRSACESQHTERDFMACKNKIAKFYREEEYTPIG